MQLLAQYPFFLFFFFTEGVLAFMWKGIVIQAHVYVQIGLFGMTSTVSPLFFCQSYKSNNLILLCNAKPRNISNTHMLTYTEIYIFFIKLSWILNISFICSFEEKTASETEFKIMQSCHKIWLPSDAYRRRWICKPDLCRYYTNQNSTRQFASKSSNHQI